MYIAIQLRCLVIKNIILYLIYSQSYFWVHDPTVVIQQCWAGANGDEL